MIRNLVIIVVTYSLQDVYYNIMVCYNPGVKVTLTGICAYYSFFYSKFLPIILA